MYLLYISCKITHNSWHLAAQHQVFHRDNDEYIKMKAVPRRKKEPQEASQDRDSQMHQVPIQRPHVSGETPRSNFDLMTCSAFNISMACYLFLSPAFLQLGHIGAQHGATTQISQSPSPAVQGSSSEVIANETIVSLPPQLASAQNELLHLVNTIVATYSSSPVLLSSLQSDLANIVTGIPWNPAQQHLNPNPNANQIAPINNQEPVVSIIDGVIRFLTQRQSALLFQPAVPGPATNLLPPLINTMNAMQQQSTAHPILPSTLQGYDPQVQQSASNFLLSDPNLQLLLGTQAQLHQTNADTTTAAISSANCPDPNAETAASDISLSNGPTDEGATVWADSFTKHQAMHGSNDRKRQRSSSPDN